MLPLHFEGKGFQVWPHQNKTATYASLIFWRGCRRSSSLLRNTENSERVENTFSLFIANRRNTCRSSPSTALVFFEHCFGILWKRVWYSLNNGLVFFEQCFGILNNVLILFKTLDWHTLNNDLVFFEQWFVTLNNFLVLFKQWLGVLWTMVWYSLNNGLVFFKQWIGILNNVLVHVKTLDWYSLNNGLVFYEQWFGILLTMG